MARPWTEFPIHFIDFEGSLGSGVLEYGVVTVRGGAIESVQGRLCSATGRIPAEDTVVHGLAPAHLAGWPPFRDDWNDFARFRESGPLAAHYAGVENSLIKQVWPYARSAPDYIRPGERSLEWGPWIDSARLYAEFRPDLGVQKLEHLVHAMGLQELLDQEAADRCPEGRRRYHAALYDALAGALLLNALAADPRVAGLSPGHLMVLSTGDAAKRRTMTQPELW